MRLVSPPRQRPQDRVQTRTEKQAPARTTTVAAPISGWIEGFAGGTSARVMENVFPTVRGVRVRGGAKKSATIGAQCRSLFTYQTAAAEKMFATSASAIYDISALDPNSAPAAAVSGLTSGYFSTEQMGTVGGEFLYAVNGTDSARLYDGAAWTTITGVSTPAITGVTTSLLSHVWKHKNRLWFVEKNTKRAWYLPVDSVGGAAASFSLAGVFQKGGYLLFGATWSEDAGDGMDDRIVFVSSEGEVAVYQGTNPASAADWAQVGLYSMAPARGMKAFIKAGGDVIVGTDDGAIPLSAVVSKDPAALAAAAVSARIEAAWRKEVQIWDGLQPWEMIKWPRENMMLVTLPHQQKTCFVANIQTGAWAKYIGWDCQCATLFNKKLYFGDRSGFIHAAETGGTDNGTAYVARLSCAPSDMGAGVAMKSVSLMRATFQALETPVVQLSVSPDYSVDFPALPAATVPSATTGALWDVALWDAALWDDDGTGDLLSRPVLTTAWTSIGAQGFVMAPQMQIVISGPGRPNIELVQFDMLAEIGNAVA